jgi:hypothetical protein
LAISLNPALVLLRQNLKKSPIGQKLNFVNHPYLCKGLLKKLLKTPLYKKVGGKWIFDDCSYLCKPL